MKNKKILALLAITNIILIGIILNLVTKNNNILKEKQIIKEMTETEYDNSITALNKSHEEYAKNVQEYKAKIAEAITNQGVSTSVDATAELMAENIEKILKARTQDATANADNITEGKTAYVNGELITGNGADNDFYYNLGVNNISGEVSILYSGYEKESSIYTFSESHKMVLVFIDIYTMKSSMTPTRMFMCRYGTVDSLPAEQGLKFAEFHNVTAGETISIIRNSSPAPETYLILAID